MSAAASSESKSESGFTGDNFKAYHAGRPPINPDFNPDYSCLFDVYQVQCIPGSEQECPDNFGNNDDATCFPLDEDGDWTCPEDYHGRDDDETGQCYPNDKGCEWEDYILIEEERRCASLSYICNEDEHKAENYCIDFCNEDPERFGCREEVT